MNKTIRLLLVFALLPMLARAAKSESPVARGEKLFERATCAGCHPHGDNLLHPTKPLKGPFFSEKYKSDAEIAKIIRSGVKDTGMPAFGKDQLSDQELKEVIAYIRSLTPSAPKRSKACNPASPSTKNSIKPKK